jgi:hypothetical protein
VIKWKLLLAFSCFDDSLNKLSSLCIFWDFVPCTRKRLLRETLAQKAEERTRKRENEMVKLNSKQKVFELISSLGLVGIYVVRQQIIKGTGTTQRYHHPGKSLSLFEIKLILIP